MSTTKSGKTETKPAVSLDVFMRDKARAACTICRLPQEVQAQLGRPAAKRGFTRPDQLDWLHKAVGAQSVTMEELVRHLNGNHYQSEESHGPA